MIDLKNIQAVAPKAFSNRATLRAVLLDQYPNQRRLVNIISLCLECGISNMIMRSSQLDEDTAIRFSSQLENEYGIQKEFCQEPLILWATFYDIPIKKFDLTILQNTCTTTTKKNNSTSFKKREPIIHSINSYHPISGDPSEFETEDDGKYLTIKKFVGFEEETFTVPNAINGKSVNTIGLNAFSGCKNIKHLIVAEGIEHIEDGAFAHCSELVSVELPESLKTLGSTKKYSITTTGVFAFCRNLREIALPSGLQYLGKSVFHSCNLFEIDLPNSIEAINGFAFSNCEALSNVLFPDNLKTIESHAFERCSSLRRISLPYGIQSIGDEAFMWCSNLLDAYIPSSVTKIGHGAFFLTSKDLTITCHANSYALEYARKCGINVKKAE